MNKSVCIIKQEKTKRIKKEIETEHKKKTKKIRNQNNKTRFKHKHNNLQSKFIIWSKYKTADTRQ